LLLQAAYSDYQIGAFENFHQLVEDTLIVLRLGPKVFFQYELRFVNRLKSQLLISHLFLPIKQMPPGQKKGREIKPLSGNTPAFFELFDQFLFQYGSPQRTIETACLTMATPVANAAELVRNSRASNIGAIRIC
jgi:hypothetical protein